VGNGASVEYLQKQQKECITINYRYYFWVYFTDIPVGAKTKQGTEATDQKCCLRFNFKQTAKLTMATTKRKKKSKQVFVSDKEWLIYLTSLNMCYVKVELMKTENGKKVAQDILDKFNGFQKWANNQIETLK